MNGYIAGVIIIVLGMAVVIIQIKEDMPKPAEGFQFLTIPSTGKVYITELSQGKYSNSDEPVKVFTYRKKEVK